MQPGCWVAGAGCAAVVFFVAVPIVCCSGVGYIGTQEIADQVRADLEGNAVLAEHLGEIEDFRMNLWDTFMVEGVEVSVFDVVGTKANGQIIAEHTEVDAEAEHVRWADLHLASGETYVLVEADEGREGEGARRNAESDDNFRKKVQEGVERLDESLEQDPDMDDSQPADDPFEDRPQDEETSPDEAVPLDGIET